MKKIIALLSLTTILSGAPFVAFAADPMDQSAAYDNMETNTGSETMEQNTAGDSDTMEDDISDDDTSSASDFMTGAENGEIPTASENNTGMTFQEATESYNNLKPQQEKLENDIKAKNEAIAKAQQDKENAKNAGDKDAYDKAEAEEKRLTAERNDLSNQKQMIDSQLEPAETRINQGEDGEVPVDILEGGGVDANAASSWKAGEITGVDCSGASNLFECLRKGLVQKDKELDKVVRNRGYVNVSTQSGYVNVGKQSGYVKVGKQSGHVNVGRQSGYVPTARNWRLDQYDTAAQDVMLALDYQVLLNSWYGYHFWVMDYGWAREYMLTPWSFGYLSYHHALGDTMGGLSAAEGIYNLAYNGIGPAMGVLSGLVGVGSSIYNDVSRAMDSYGSLRLSQARREQQEATDEYNEALDSAEEAEARAAEAREEAELAQGAIEGLDSQIAEAEAKAADAAAREKQALADGDAEAAAAAKAEKEQAYKDASNFKTQKELAENAVEEKNEEINAYEEEAERHRQAADKAAQRYSDAVDRENATIADEATGVTKAETKYAEQQKKTELAQNQYEKAMETEAKYRQNADAAAKDAQEASKAQTAALDSADDYLKRAESAENNGDAEMAAEYRAKAAEQSKIAEQEGDKVAAANKAAEVYTKGANQAAEIVKQAGDNLTNARTAEEEARQDFETARDDFLVKTARDENDPAPEVKAPERQAAVDKAAPQGGNKGTADKDAGTNKSSESKSQGSSAKKAPTFSLRGVANDTMDLINSLGDYLSGGTKSKGSGASKGAGGSSSVGVSQSRGASGETLGASGKTLGASGETMGTSGTTMGASGTTMGASGETMGASGETMGTSGTTMGASGETIGTSGTTLGN